MIRKSLYLAASAAVLMTAAQAQAASISGTGTFGNVTSTATAGAYLLAAEVARYSAVTSSATATQGDLTFDINPTNSFTTGQSVLLTIDLSGGVFTGDDIEFTSGTACDVDSVVEVTPAAEDETVAEYLVQLSGVCSATATGSGFSVTVPAQVTGTALTLGAKMQQSFGGQLINVDGGRTSARFVTVAPAFSAEIEAAGDDVVALVSEGYRELDNSGATVGTLVVDVDTDVNLDLAGTAASDGEIEGVALTATALTGSFTGYNLQVAGELFTSGTVTATVSTVRVSNEVTSTGSYGIQIIDNTSTATTAGINADAVIPASTFSVTAVVDLASGLTDVTATGSLDPVTRDGTSFVAPWIALGSAAANSTIRLANNGSTDTGPIQMTLTSSNGSETTTETVTIGAGQLVAGELTTAGGIAAGGVVSISGAALKEAFGTDAANGDLEVTIEAQPQFISGKVRVTQASGQVFESSLGNLSN